jgi:hypothetical protein
MATTADLINETKRHLLSFQREPLNKLVAGVGPTATTFTLTYDVSTIQQGAHLQIGLELVYVWSVDQSSKVVTVERGQLGSTALTHSAGALVTVNPKFPDFAILKALNDELADLSSPLNGLYSVRAAELTATSNSSGYNLPTTNLLEILSIEQRHVGNPRTWMPITNYWLQQNSETDDFTSGTALHLTEGVRSGQPIRVLYKASFSPLLTLIDDVTAVTGMPTSMQDIPPMGAAVRLVAPREIKRNFTEGQGEPRRAAEVPPGAVQASMRSVAAMRQNRIAAEAGRLAQQHPERGFIPAPAMVW